MNVGQLSPILDDGRSPTISIVRVIERTDAGREEFSEVQDEIKEKLMEAHRAKDKDKIHVYIEKLCAETKIWTIYDDQPQTEAVAGQTPGQARTPSTSMRPNTSSVRATPDNPYLR